MQSEIVVEPLLCSVGETRLFHSEERRGGEQNGRFAHALGRIDRARIRRVRQQGHAQIDGNIAERRNLVRVRSTGVQLARRNPTVLLLISPPKFFHGEQPDALHATGANHTAQHDILADRGAVASSLEAQLDAGTGPWGVKVERVEMYASRAAEVTDDETVCFFVCSKDVRLPQSMQRSMAAEAEASREARAKVIAAEGEQKASRQLKEAADVIATSPTALQLRYLQTLTQIAAEKNSTIVFPLPGRCPRGIDRVLTRSSFV